MKCILCSSDSVFPIGFSKHARRVFLRCPECDLIFVPESFHLPPHDEAARYRLHKNTLSNDGYVGMFIEKIALVHQYCPGARSALDYGCGPEPVLAELLKRDGFSCDVYDPCFFPVFPDGAYDLVISTEVFEHLRDIGTELRRIHRLLKPGGYLAVMTSLHDIVSDFKNWWYASDLTHICFFGARTFEWIAKEFGFGVIYTNKKNFIILQLKKKLEKPIRASP